MLFKLHIENPVASLLSGVIGFLLLIFAIRMLLWRNEGDFVAARIALDKFSAAATQVDERTIDPRNNGRVVLATAQLISGETLGDSPYLKSGEYLRLERRVEMFQWVERRMSGRSGSYYRYRQQWREGYVASATFTQPAGHVNRPPAVRSASLTVKSSSFGAFDGQAILARAEPEPLQLTTHMADGREYEVRDNAIYLQQRGEPKNGDLRVKYAVVRSGQFTAMGVQQEDRGLSPHRASYGGVDFPVRRGAFSIDQMIEASIDEAEKGTSTYRRIGMAITFVAFALCACASRRSKSLLDAFLVATVGAFILSNAVIGLASFTNYSAMAAAVAAVGLVLASIAIAAALSRMIR